MSVPPRGALAALAAGLLAALLLPGVPAGVGYVIVAAALAGAAMLAGRPRHPLRAAVLAVLALALALSATLRDAGWVVAGELAGSVILGSIAMSVPHGWRATGLAALAAPYRMPVGALRLGRGLLAATPRGSAGGMLAVGRGLLLAGALLATFGALFASGDRAFAQLAGDVLPGDLPVSDLPLRALVFGIVVALAGGLMQAAAVADAPARRPLLLIGPVEWRLASSR